MNDRNCFGKIANYPNEYLGYRSIASQVASLKLMAPFVDGFVNEELHKTIKAGASMIMGGYEGFLVIPDHQHFFADYNTARNTVFQLLDLKLQEKDCKCMFSRDFSKFFEQQEKQNFMNLLREQQKAPFLIVQHQLGMKYFSLPPACAQKCISGQESFMGVYEGSVALMMYPGRIPIEKNTASIMDMSCFGDTCENTNIISFRNDGNGINVNDYNINTVCIVKATASMALPDF